MTWLLAGPILVFLLGIAALLPYASLQTAARNTRRSGGQRSRRRTRRELRYLGSFLRNGVLVPLLALVLMQGGLFFVHTTVIPDNTVLSEIFGEYHPETSLHAPDLDAWNEAIEADRRERALRASQQMQGLLPPPPPPPISEVLLEHWPIHLAFLFLPMAYVVWFFRRRYVALAQAYHHGVARRHKGYTEGPFSLFSVH
jgi:hypothetical protein